MINFDDKDKKARLSLRVHEFLPELQRQEVEAIANNT